MKKEPKECLIHSERLEQAMAVLYNTRQDEINSNFLFSKGGSKISYNLIKEFVYYGTLPIGVKSNAIGAIFYSVNNEESMKKAFNNNFYRMEYYYLNRYVILFLRKHFDKNQKDDLRNYPLAGFFISRMFSGNFVIDIKYKSQIKLEHHIAYMYYVYNGGFIGNTFYQSELERLYDEYSNSKLR